MKAKLKDRFTPHPNTYYLFGLLSRFTAKHSEVLPAGSGRPAGAASAATGGGRAAQSQGPGQPAGGERDVLGRGRNHLDCRIGARHRAAPLPHRREMPATVPKSPSIPPRRFAVGPDRPGFADRIPRLSVTVYSSYELSHRQPGVMAEEIGTAQVRHIPEEIRIGQID